MRGGVATRSRDLASDSLSLAMGEISAPQTNASRIR